MRAFLRYATSRATVNVHEKAYRSYVSEGLRVISESAANIRYGPYLKVRLSDIMYPKPKDERTGEEIATELFSRMGIQIIQEGGEEQ